MNWLWAVWAAVVLLARCPIHTVETTFEDIYNTNKEIRVLPVQDDIAVRDVREEMTNMTTKNPFKGGSDQEWLEEAIKDIAYYLRAHKFNEYDRRYELNGALAPRAYHRTFPRPPLRSLHWEVHKFCDESFLVCIEYLWKRVQGAGLRRADDTSIIIQEQHWKVDVNQEQIGIVDGECQKLKTRDNALADPFQGPLERFQWRTTASYFMCWYAMNEVEHLRHITENCDNFAGCLDPKFGVRNRDYRANDDTPFACALYSFCPDPCCEERHMTNAEDCWKLHNANPCYSSAPESDRQCILNRTENVDFAEGILNHWNVTCSCPKPGYVWDSRYGICVDVDECMRGTHTCKKSEGEACLNTRGGFKCVCKWGHTWEEGKCAPHEAVAQIKLTALKAAEQQNVENGPLERSYLRRLYKYLKKVLVNSASMLIGSTYYPAAIVTFAASSLYTQL